MNKNSYTQNELVGSFLYSVQLIFLSYVLGSFIQFIFIPHPATKAPIAFRFLIGAGILFAAKVLRAFGIMIARIIHNRKYKKLDSMMVMQTQEEFDKAGVRTPLDFCYLMLTTSFETPLNIFNGSPARLRQLKDIDVYAKDVLLFKKMFGRNPMKADSFDWLSVTIYEMYTHNKKIESDLTFEDLKQLVSPEILALPTRFTEEWSLEIQRQFKPRCEILANQLNSGRKKVV